MLFCSRFKCRFFSKSTKSYAKVFHPLADPGLLSYYLPGPSI
jgi:hypothetical protein